MTAIRQYANLDKLRAWHDKFHQVYADAVIPDITDEQFRVAAQIRQLNWHGERMPLIEAAIAYAKIWDRYNEFRPNMLKRLLEAFGGVDIEATPARESSVVVYLHIPADIALTGRVRAWIELNLHPDEIDFVTEFTCLQDGEAELDGEALRIWWD